jgi:hypothetical protein
MAFMGNTLPMMMLLLWPSRSDRQWLTATLMRWGCRLLFSKVENVCRVVVNMWKNKYKYFKA